WPLRLRDRRARSRDRRALGAAAVDGLAGEQLLDLVARQRLIFEQRLGERFELLAEFLEHVLGAVVPLVDDAADLLVDRTRGLVGHVSLAIDGVAEEHFLV